MKKFHEIVKEERIHSNANIEFLSLSFSDKKREYHDRLKYISCHRELMNSFVYDYDIEPETNHQAMLVRVTIASIPEIKRVIKPMSKSAKVLVLNKKKYAV